MSAAGGLRAAACSERIPMLRTERSRSNFLQAAEDAGGSGPETQKARERRQKTGWGAALRTLSALFADAGGLRPLRAPTCLQKAQAAAKDLLALGWCRRTGIRGLCMRATSCFLQSWGSCLPGSLAVRSLAPKFVGGRGAAQRRAPTRASRHCKVSE